MRPPLRLPALVPQSPPAKAFWTVPPIWKGERAFLIGGGPSVLDQDLAPLHGRRVIAINSSYERAPFAEILFFGDLDFWLKHRTRIVDFPGRVVTCRPSPGDLKNAEREILIVERQLPPGLAGLPTRVVFRRCSFSSAINLAVHLGAADIVTLGLDGGPNVHGVTHHHERETPVKPWCWREQAAELATLVGPLRDRGVRLYNASPGSALKLWPIVQLTDCL